MIREYKETDAGSVMQIWLSSNIEAHPFIPKAYWESNYQTVEAQLLQAEVYVYEANGTVQGFIGLAGQYIAGIFVDRRYRSGGVGKKLLDYAKDLYDELSLSVYVKNERAAAFYGREGFEIFSEGMDEENGEREYTMSWKKDEEEWRFMKLREHEEWAEKASRWFASKWGIPEEAYLESMEQCTVRKAAVPQWYVVVNGKNDIIAGAGVIENDFHNRKDLSPNLCALFVEKTYRKQGIARKLLDFVRADMSGMGISRLYLVTDHMEFYEKCGWNFLTMVQDDEGYPERMYVAETGGQV